MLNPSDDEELKLPEIDPWNADAAHLNDEDFERLGTFGDVDIRRFCLPGSGSERAKVADAWTAGGKFVLVGQRGLGKSHLLAYRSHNHRNADKGTTFFHPYGGQSRQLVEYLTLLSGTMTEKHWLRSRAAAGDWAALWQVAILGFLVWRLCDPDVRKGLRAYTTTFARINDLDEAFQQPDDTSSEPGTTLAGPRLQWFLGAVIESQPGDRLSGMKTLQALNHFAESGWALAIRSAVQRRKYKRIALYIDNPDELVTTQEQEIWANVQQGLLLAIWKMRKGRVLEELNIFASVRSEAIYERQHPDLISALDLAIHLRYDRAALEEMFVSRVRLTRVGQMALPDLAAPTMSSVDAIKAFLGFSEYTHHRRLGTDSLPEREQAIDAIIRHSRLVPRELVLMGRAIASSDAGKLRTIDTVKTKVNTEARGIVDYVRSNCFPPWTAALNQTLCSISTSVLTSERLHEIAQKHDSAGDGWAQLRVLMGLGLLGYAVPNTRRHRHCYTQRFMFHRAGDIVFADTAFFFVHPATKEWIRANSGRKGGWNTEDRPLIGDGLPFESHPPIVRLTLEHDQPTIQIAGEILQSNSGTATDPIKFLFVSMLAWKLRMGARWPTMNDLRRLCSQVEPLKSLQIASDQVPENSQARKWAKRLNKMPVIRKMQSPRSDSAPQGSKDGRRSDRISIKAPEGTEASVMLVGLDAADIDVHEKVIASLE